MARNLNFKNKVKTVKDSYEYKQVHFKSTRLKWNSYSRRMSTHRRISVLRLYSEVIAVKYTFIMK